jgi:hypothetical protein
MPNCDFYASGKDYEDVLSFIFDNLNVRVLEMNSAFGSGLIEFNSLAEVVESEPYFKLNEENGSLHLALWPVEAGGAVEIKKIRLNPDKCSGHTFRYQAVGWGLIQLYFCDPTGMGLRNCHTNHNSAARAAKWASTYPEYGSPSAWDWSIVSSVSSKLNRHIRKIAVAKSGSRSVLPVAHSALENEKAAV